MHLLGPWPFDPLSPERSGREALAGYAAQPVDLSDTATGAAAGLYLLVDEDGALRGFWITVSDAWLDDGAAGGVTPPFAKGLLDAATEEIWWERFQVAPRILDAWRPVVIIEWPPHFATRSDLPPPGIPLQDHDELEPQAGDPGEDAGWLEPDDLPLVDAIELIEDDTVDTAWRNLPPDRSVVCIIRGSLRRTRSVHEGRFQLVCMNASAEGGLGLASMPRAWRQGIPLEEWLEEAAAESPAPPADHTLGYPLRLFGDRVGFPLSGWLTRDLEVYPPRPSDAAVGILVPRDTRNPLWGQIAMAVALTAVVLMGTLSLSGAAYYLQQPRTDRAAAPIAQAPQPAISVCSADHRRFVEQFRCHVRHLATGGALATEDCGRAVDESDLQAGYCGLRDRDDDGYLTPNGHRWADVAAAQACFDVLGQPYEYALKDTRGQRADPPRLLEDVRLRVNALVAVVDELDQACDTYGTKLESKVAGGILATHVGGAGAEREALRDLAFQRAAIGMNRGAQQCFTAGRTDGVATSTTWEGLCGPDPAEARWTTSKAWQALGGPAPSHARPLVDRYVMARFGRRSPVQDLWTCHDRLDRATQADRAPARWDLSAAVPGSYLDTGITSQLQLDAWLLAVREDGAATNSCWSEVDRLLASYTPAHPLSTELEATPWPSEQQKVCASVCAARYGVDRATDPWVTPDTDLSLCVDDTPMPEDQAYKLGDGRLDRLRMPWNQAPDGTWLDPDEPAICAFNLLAQNRLPTILPEGIPAPVWAGELASGTGIAGGASGAAARSAESLSRYGANRSTATCAYAAAQCLTAEMLTVTGDRYLGPHEWRDAWRRRVADISRASNDELRDRPWCHIIRPYIDPNGQLPEGQLDFTCALGVEDVRGRVDETVASLASGAYLRAAP